jgi:hypothetical protein
MAMLDSWLPDSFRQWMAGRATQSAGESGPTAAMPLTDISALSPWLSAPIDGLGQDWAAADQAAGSAPALGATPRHGPPEVPGGWPMSPAEARAAWPGVGGNQPMNVAPGSLSAWPVGYAARVPDTFAPALPSLGGGARPGEAASATGGAAGPGPSAASSGSLFDRITSGINDNSNMLLGLAGGFAGAPSFGAGLSRALSGAQAGAQMDARQRPQPQRIGEAFQALARAGVPPRQALAAVYNPDVMKAIAEQVFGGASAAQRTSGNQPLAAWGNIQSHQPQSGPIQPPIATPAPASALGQGPNPSATSGNGSGTADIATMIREAAARRGIDPAVLLRIGQMESGLRPGAAARKSSAKGLFQFTNPTWARYGRGRDVFDPAANADAGARFTADNVAGLKAAGLSATPGNVYLAHFAGLGGARSVLAADPATPAGDILGAKAVRANPWLGTMSAGDLRAWADRKMSLASTNSR